VAVLAVWWQGRRISFRYGQVAADDSVAIPSERSASDHLFEASWLRSLALTAHLDVDDYDQWYPIKCFFVFSLCIPCVLLRRLRAKQDAENPKLKQELLAKAKEKAKTKESAKAKPKPKPKPKPKAKTTPKPNVKHCGGAAPAEVSSDDDDDNEDDDDDDDEAHRRLARQKLARSRKRNRQLAEANEALSASVTVCALCSLCCQSSL
jgi:hypothetical protein